MKEQYVAILKEKIFDYSTSPFNPSEAYPELSLLPYEVEVDPKNPVYSMVRKILPMCKLDETNYGTEKWNPFSEIVAEGNTIVIKPNLVRDTHPFGEKAVLSTVTHASVLRPIIDYAILSLKGRGKIVVCDAPLQSADFQNICEINGLGELIRFYKSKVRNIQITLLDLRKEMMLLPNERHGRERVIKLRGDPLGYTIVNLEENSFHSGIHNYWKKYAVTGYDLKNLKKYHTNKKHCYCISNTILNADVFISIPKLKTHKKAGITVALKNSIGANASKDFLPHHRRGRPQNGGDEYPSNTSILTLLKDRIETISRKIPKPRGTFSFLQRMYPANETERKYNIMEGNWDGNDTLWRTILDLNIILKYSNKNGRLDTTSQRNFLFLVDGIIGQEGEGPMNGRPKKCGILLLGTNPCAVDYVAAKLMGFSHEYIKQISASFKERSKMRYPFVRFDGKEIEVVSNVDEYIKIHELTRENSLRFAAPMGWKRLEVD